MSDSLAAGTPADSGSWQRLRELFDSAYELDGGARAELLERACAGDQPMRAEVEKLLAAHDRAAAFIETPISGDLADPDLDPTVTVDIPDPEADGAPQWLVLGNRYRVKKKIAQAGFGEVYFASDEQVGSKPVVVKVLRQGLPRDEWRRKHFEQEMKVLARISHPGVVGVLDRGETPEGRPFLVLEYVPGKTLRRALEDGPLTVARAARLIREIGQALGAAHREGVWHRDLKPDNVMLRDLGAGDERAVVIDFGIASVRQPEGGDAVTTVCAGAPQYMAPEQLLGRASAASDVHALGLVAFEMLTGQRLLALKSDDSAPPAELARRELGRLRPQVPPAAADLLATSLAFEPSARPGDARVFAERLATLLEGGVARPGRRWFLAAAGIVLAVAAALVFRGGVPRGPAAPAERVIQFTVLCQRSGERAAPARPFLPGPDTAFGAGDKLRFIFESPQDGVLYLINESLAAGRSGPDYNLLLAGGAAQLKAGRELWVPAGSGDWIEFDTRKGIEKVWLVWAAEKVGALAPLERFAGPEHRGAVRDREAAGRLREFLATSAELPVGLTVDAARLRTTVRVRGPLLAHCVGLPHN